MTYSDDDAPFSRMALLPASGRCRPSVHEDLRFVGIAVDGRFRRIGYGSSRTCRSHSPVPKVKRAAPLKDEGASPFKLHRLLIALLLLASTSAVALAASGTFYRACCVEDPTRHGCSAWFESEHGAQKAGAEHRQKTGGHDWTIESRVVGE